ncbi:MAG: transglycosylase SLT domain-containing protein [Fibrobacterota bacterium]
MHPLFFLLISCLLFPAAAQIVPVPDTDSLSHYNGGPILLPPFYLPITPQAYEDLPKDSIADFEEALSLRQRARWSESLRALRKAYPKTRYLKDYTLYYQVEALLFLGREKEALKVFRTLLRRGAEKPAAQKAGRLLLANKLPQKPENRIKLEEKLLSGKNDPLLRYAYANDCLALSDTGRALNAFFDLLSFRAGPFLDDSAYKKLRHIEKTSGPFDADKSERLAKYLNSQNRWDELWDRAIPFAKNTGPLQDRFLQYLYTAAFRQKNYRRALLFITLYEKRNGPSAYTEYATANALKKLGLYGPSRRRFNAFLKKYPNDGRADGILWDVARKLEDNQRFPRAIHYFLRIHNEYRKENFADKAYFRAGYCHYKNNNTDSALKIFNELPKLYPRSVQTEACPYWEAMALEKKGDTAAATARYRFTLKDNAFSFYAFRARERLTALGCDSLARGFDGRDSAAVDSFLATLQKPKGDPRLIPAWSRGLLLLKAGADSFAVSELALAERPADHDLLLLHRLLNTYARLGRFREAFRLSRIFQWKLPDEKSGEFPKSLLKDYYPRYFGEAVVMECRKYGLDPFLVHAVMRQESTYDPSIVSPAGAIGLLQLMPATAANVAQKLHIPFTPDSLFSPFYNIRLGVYHLVELLDQFEGRRELVYCAYNAGPGATREWQKRGKGLPYDEFVEEVGYTETRTYVKKCERNLRAYRMLWGEEGTEKAAK